jgi:hypothetical protein
MDTLFRLLRIATERRDLIAMTLLRIRIVKAGH